MSLRTVPACMAALSVAVLAACTTAAGAGVAATRGPARRRRICRPPGEHRGAAGGAGASAAAPTSSSRIHGDAVVYLYADPLVCNCLYIGSQEAYGRYRQERLQQRMLEQQQQIVDEQQMNADRIEDSGWDWGMWGPGFYR